MPSKPYLVIPEVSSERREYIPIGYLNPTTLASNKLRLLPNATPFEFGTLISRMHMAWMRYTCGRLKSDYQYSIHIVYNNYPWPQTPSDTQRQAIETAAQTVLDVRASFKGQSLADLYDPDVMPPELRKAHQRLDKAVDAAYGYKGGPDDTARVAFLFGLYQQLTSATAPLAEPRKPARKTSKNP
jgi:hypothetical protein